MSKLYKELKYDTDRVMQPGDPLTSPDGQTKVKVNDDGTALISYGNSYEVTLTIPEVSGASFRVRFTKGTTSGGMAAYSALITSISGLENAVADQYGGRGISVNGEYWGEVAVMATDAIFQESGDPLPDSSKRMPIFGGFYANFYLRSPEGLSSWCDWSNLSQPVETVEKEISIEGHTHSASDINSGVLPIAFGGTGVNGTSQGSNKVLASPSTGSSGTIAFRSLVAADIPDLSTSKLTTGTLGVAQGGTGVNGSSQAINKVLASPASGSAGAISFRSLTVADLPTGTTASTVALGNHTHSDYVSKSTTSNQNISGAITLVNTGNITVSPTSGGVSAGIGVASGNDAYVHASQDGVGGTEINPTGFAHYHPDGTVTDLTFPVPAKSGVIVTSTSLAENLNILPITTSTALTITMTADKYMYKVTDSGATGTFPTLTAPTGLPADCYYKFEMEWVTASPTATYAQTASTTPAMKWITSPVMQTDGLTHTYHISGRYDTTTSTFWMSCWKIDEAQGTITPDAHALKYLLTTPTQTTSTTTNTNDTITVQLSDHAINSVNVPVSVTNVVLKFPGQAVGKARDFMVRLVVTGETVPSITLTEPDGSAIDFDVDDDSWTEIEQGVNLLMFTETAQ